MSSIPYIELESIESTGTQWINTNIVDYDNEMKMSLRFKIANYSDSAYISAAQNTSYSNTSIGLYLYKGFVTAFKGSTSHKVSMVEIDTTTIYNVDITQTGVIVNNISATFTSSAVSVSYPYEIFCANRGGNAVYPSSIILYNYALEKYLGSDLGLKVNLIPVQLISDIPASMSSQGITHSAGEIGMWDKVTNTFFGNSGTGDFIAHYKSNAMALLLRRRAMMESKPWLEYGIELEAIENSDYAYIDTGIKNTLIPSVYIEFELTTWVTNNNLYVIGSRDTSGNSQPYYIIATSTENMRVYRSGSNYTFAPTLIGETSFIDTKLCIFFSKYKRIINGIESETSSSISMSIESNISLCALMTGTTIQTSLTSAKYFRLQLQDDNDNSLLDFIPFQLTTNIPTSLSSQGIAHSAGEVGMWDKVSNTFFGNSGTGEFIPHYKS